ncbi:unnamed protein product [Blepharisma stoltei]|uniref:Uncharacterized protein n=1 Tax=Blepharisma stoltei TaxID=1481888 RepID=A0AAU9JXC8_9CILI|nr:unnamed protein product [Blepharisma stoltei]
MPKADAGCHSLVFNGNILISGCASRNLTRYSIDANNFTNINYDFSESKRKILIKVERFYLIECGKGWIYESEIDDYTFWKQIGRSIISHSCPYQAYCSYNKKAIHIGLNLRRKQYYKFDLEQNQWINTNEEKNWISNNKNCLIW